MEMNEHTLKDLMDAIDNASPSDFAEALDTAMKVKCADAIDARRAELAASIHESKCKDKMYEEEDEEEMDDDDDEKDLDEEKADKDYDGDGEVESEKDEYFGSKKKAAKEKGEWSEEYKKKLNEISDKKEREALERTLASFEKDYKTAKGSSKNDLKKAIEKIRYDLGMKGGVNRSFKKDLGGRVIGIN